MKRSSYGGKNIDFLKNPIVNEERGELCFKSADKLALFFPPTRFYFGWHVYSFGDEQSRLFRARK